MSRKIDKRTESWNRQRWQQETLKVFQAMVRYESAIDGACQCVCCGVKGDPRDFDAGHFISRKHNATAFSENPPNVHPCCVRCNQHEHGNLIAYYDFMRTAYGQDAVDELKRKSRELKTWTIPELQEMRAEFRRRLKQAKDNNVNN